MKILIPIIKNAHEYLQLHLHYSNTNKSKQFINYWSLS